MILSWVQWENVKVWPHKCYHCYALFCLQQTLSDELEKTQPQLSDLAVNGRLFLEKVPDVADRAFLESQLNTLEELQASVVRKSLAKQEELIRCIVQQQDFQTQLQSCMHVLQVSLRSSPSRDQRTLIPFVNVTGRCGRTDGVAYDSDETGYPSRTGSVSSEAVSSCTCRLRLPYPTDQFWKMVSAFRFNEGQWS